jgi:hypothetical protein
MEIASVTPSLPQWGRQHEGGKLPLTPTSGWIFLKYCRSTIHTAMLHGASPYEAVSARGTIASDTGPIFVFLKSMISTEQINSLFIAKHAVSQIGPWI